MMPQSWSHGWISRRQAQRDREEHTWTAARCCIQQFSHIHLYVVVFVVKGNFVFVICLRKSCRHELKQVHINSFVNLLRCFSEHSMPYFIISHTTYSHSSSQSVKFTHWAYSSLNHHLAPEERDIASFSLALQQQYPKIATKRTAIWGCCGLS